MIANNIERYFTLLNFQNKGYKITEEIAKSVNGRPKWEDRYNLILKEATWINENYNKILKDKYLCRNIKEAMTRMGIEIKKETFVSDLLERLNNNLEYIEREYMCESEEI